MNQIDVIVVGGGVSGLSAALYTSKAGLKTLVIDFSSSQLNKVETLWNVPGIGDGISGMAWLENARDQVMKFEGEIVGGKVASLSFAQRPYSVIAEDGQAWTAQYVVLAVNLGFDLLSQHGFELSVNEYVPSRKVQKVNGISYDGKTHIPGVYVAGLLADVPSQAIIAAGQGTFVGIQIATEHGERPYMWHD